MHHGGVHGRTPSLSAALLASLAVAAPAHAATTVGQTQAASGYQCGSSAGSTMVQSGSTSSAYVVPAGGVITRMSVGPPGPSAIVGDSVEGRVFRPGSGGTWTGVGHVPIRFADTTGVQSAPARLVVQAGDVLGLSWATSGQFTCSDEAAAADFVSYPTPNAYEPDGRAFAAPVSISQTRVNIAATLEPDADHDAYGDETQDACPTDELTQGRCQSDLAVRQSRLISSIPLGGLQVLSLGVSNAPSGGGRALSPRVTEPLPPGLELVAASSSTGSCASGPGIDCTLDSLVPGASASLVVVLRATSAGEKSVTALVAHTRPDPVAANNAATSAFSVVAPPPGAQPKPVARCRLIRLRGLRLPVVRKVLKAGGCRLGKVKRPKHHRKGRLVVKSQTRKPGLLRANTRVGVTLKRAR